MQTLHNKFTDDFDVFSCYIMGLIWADGSIIPNKKNENRGSLSICMVEKDYNDLQSILHKYIKWGIYIVKPQKKTWQYKVKLTSYDRDLYNIFKNYNYKHKSLNSPHLVLEYIPKSLHNHFWRGYFDGDGCITSKLDELCFTSSKHQCWNSLSQLCDNLSIHYHIRQRKSKTGEGSDLRITSYSEIMKMIDYLYVNHQNILLHRKYNKCMKIYAIINNSARYQKYKGIRQYAENNFAFRFLKNKKWYYRSGFKTKDEALAAKLMFIEVLHQDVFHDDQKIDSDSLGNFH